MGVVFVYSFLLGALVSSHLSTLRLTFHIRALPAGCGHSIVLLLPADADAPVSVLAAGCWLLAAGAGRWLLAAGRWPLVLVLLAAGCWPLVLLAAGCWPLVLVLLAAGRWLLAAMPTAGCWLLAAGAGAAGAATGAGAGGGGAAAAAAVAAVAACCGCPQDAPKKCSRTPRKPSVRALRPIVKTRAYEESSGASAPALSSAAFFQCSF